MATDKDQERAKDQARAQLDSIIELVKALEKGEDVDGQDPQEAIREDPLSIQVRSNWHAPGDEARAGEYEILLCTGGPACRIVGDLNEHQEPESASIEYQDWFTPWESYPINSDEVKALLAYAGQFYYGA